jgi:HPt (histidine-containing phosphotransfer) domain-containing protein
MTTRENQEILDMRVVEQLVAHKRMGQTAFERLVPVFLEEAHLLAEQMRCAVAASDGEGLRLTAHKLKGSSSVIGAAEVSAVSQKIMAAAEAGERHEAELLQALERALDRFRDSAEKFVGH